jgi:hypothetical protein
LQKRLNGLGKGESGEDNPDGMQHALWEYYQPILRTLIAIGEDANRSQIEEKFGELYRDWLKPGDEVLMSSGKPKWQVMIGRAKKPMQAEGFVEAPTAFIWSITDAGRKAANRKDRSAESKQG